MKTYHNSNTKTEQVQADVAKGRQLLRYAFAET